MNAFAVLSKTAANWIAKSGEQVLGGKVTFLGQVKGEVSWAFICKVKPQYSSE